MYNTNFVFQSIQKCNKYEKNSKIICLIKEDTEMCHASENKFASFWQAQTFAKWLFKTNYTYKFRDKCFCYAALFRRDAHTRVQSLCL